MKQILFYLSVLVLTACDGNVLNDDEPKVVVEGWIEEGQTPHFYVTRSISVSDVKKDYARVEDHVLPHEATLIVSDGKKQYPLYCRETNGLYIPVCYTNDSLVGQSGKTYQVEVSVEGQQIIAQTTIPQSGYQGWIEKTIDPNAPNSYSLRLHITSLGPEEYGRVFIYIDGITDDFVLSPGALILGSELCASTDSESCIPISRPDFQYIANDNDNFRCEEQIRVRVSMMSYETYQMWEEYEKRLDLSRNPLFPLTANLESTFGNQVLGYWAGYSSWYYDITD